MSNLLTIIQACLIYGRIDLPGYGVNKTGSRTKDAEVIFSNADRCASLRATDLE